MFDTVQRLILRCDWPDCDAECGAELGYEDEGDEIERFYLLEEADDWDQMWNGKGFEQLCPRHKEQRATELRIPSTKQTGPTLFGADS